MQFIVINPEQKLLHPRPPCRPTHYYRGFVVTKYSTDCRKANIAWLHHRFFL